MRREQKVRFAVALATLIVSSVGVIASPRLPGILAIVALTASLGAMTLGIIVWRRAQERP